MGCWIEERAVRIHHQPPVLDEAVIVGQIAAELLDRRWWDRDFVFAESANSAHRDSGGSQNAGPRERRESAVAENIPVLCLEALRDPWREFLNQRADFWRDRGFEHSVGLSLAWIGKVAPHWAGHREAYGASAVLATRSDRTHRVVT